MKWNRLLPVLLLTCLVLGCRGGSGRGTLHGKVMHKDKPVTAGLVRFVPEAGEAIKATIGINGTYRASDLPPGKYRVAVETLQFRNLTPPPPQMKVGGGRPVYVPIPPQYEKPETSGLTCVVDTGTKEWNIDLP